MQSEGGVTNMNMEENEDPPIELQLQLLQLHATTVVTTGDIYALTTNDSFNNKGNGNQSFSSDVLTVSGNRKQLSFDNYNGGSSSRNRTISYAEELQAMKQKIYRQKEISYAEELQAMKQKIYRQKELEQQIYCQQEIERLEKKIKKQKQSIENIKQKQQTRRQNYF